MIKIVDVYKKYKNKFVLKKINFEIAEGEVVGLIGSNGAGKTTIIKLIFGDEKITEGKILFDEIDIFKGDNLKSISYLPDSRSMPDDVVVEDYLNYIADLNEVSNKENIIDHLLESFNVNEHRKKLFKQLSSGLQKKLMLCSCLIKKPKLIIMDEPTAALDVPSKIDMINTIKTINSMGIAILIASHIFDELEKIINRLIIIEKGKIVFNNKYDNLKTIQSIFEENVKSDGVDQSEIKKIYEHK